MSVQFDSSRNRWVVRWYDGGRQRSRRFHDEQAARHFNADRVAAKTAARDATTAIVAMELAQVRARVDKVERQWPADARTTGVFPYPTRAGVRWRIAVTREDGTASTRRGYATHEAACHVRDRLASADRAAAGVSFARFWRRWLADERSYLTAGAVEDLDAHGRKRLLPCLAHRAVGNLTEHDVREWMARMRADRDRRAVSAKTINNARAALSSALTDAVRQGLLPRNPCRFVAPLPADRTELDYLHLDEIDRYLRPARLITGRWPS
jgi:hypothetical protein